MSILVCYSILYPYHNIITLIITMNLAKWIQVTFFLFEIIGYKVINFVKLLLECINRIQYHNIPLVS